MTTQMNDPHTARLVAITKMDLELFDTTHCPNARADLMLRTFMRHINDPYLVIRSENFRNTMRDKIAEMNSDAQRYNVTENRKKMITTLRDLFDQTLKRIQTDPAYQTSVPPVSAPLPNATDTFCPATGAARHNYGKSYQAGNSWHGPVWAADCADCKYHYCDH